MRSDMLLGIEGKSIRIMLRTVLGLRKSIETLELNPFQSADEMLNRPTIFLLI